MYLPLRYYLYVLLVRNLYGGVSADEPWGFRWRFSGRTRGFLVAFQRGKLPLFPS